MAIPAVGSARDAFGRLSLFVARQVFVFDGWTAAWSAPPSQTHERGHRARLIVVPPLACLIVGQSGR
jgi:hypothetical protein